jgi:uncharacterized protein (DUF2336 family)
MAMARKLALHPQAPRPILQALINADDECAALIFALSGGGVEESPVAVLNRPSPPADDPFARQHELDRAFMNMLLECEEEDLARALAQNPGVPLGAEALLGLALRARGEKDLARAICARCNDPEVLQPLFLYASRMQRAVILLEAEREAIIQGAVGASIDPVLSGQIENLALARDTVGFRRRLAGALRCDIEAVREIIEDPDGEPLAVALASLGMKAEAINRIFLMGDEAIAHSCEKIELLDRLASQISAGAARIIVRAMVGASSDFVPRRVGTSDGPAQATGRIAASVSSRRSGAPLFLFRARK